MRELPKRLCTYRRCCSAVLRHGKSVSWGGYRTEEYPPPAFELPRNCRVITDCWWWSASFSDAPHSEKANLPGIRRLSHPETMP